MLILTPPHTQPNNTHTQPPNRELLTTGSGQVAFHHAGISADDRACVERLFGQGQVRVLCSTSTLAVGINTPAHLVVIKGAYTCARACVCVCVCVCVEGFG